MRHILRRSLPALLIAGAACSHASQQPASPTPAPAVTAPAGRGAAPAGAPGAQAQPGGGRGQGPAMTPEQRAARRDSISTVRGEMVQRVLATIAGREAEPAGKVFKNVQLLKDMPAGEFVKAMDTNFGRALSQGCGGCHIANQFDSDSLGRKKTTRIMIQLVAAINADHLTKMPPARNGQPRTISCVTCHRGNGNPGTALLP